MVLRWRQSPHPPGFRIDLDAMVPDAAELWRPFYRGKKFRAKYRGDLVSALSGHRRGRFF